MVKFKSERDRERGREGERERERGRERERERERGEKEERLKCILGIVYFMSLMFVVNCVVLFVYAPLHLLGEREKGTGP